MTHFIGASEERQTEADARTPAAAGAKILCPNCGREHPPHHLVQIVSDETGRSRLKYVKCAEGV